MLCAVGLSCFVRDIPNPSVHLTNGGGQYDPIVIRHDSPNVMTELSNVSIVLVEYVIVYVEPPVKYLVSVDAFATA